MKQKNKKFISFLIMVSFFSYSFSQSQENIEYLTQKEIELTNDSTYWDNHSILYFGFNRVGLHNWAAGGMNFMELIEWIINDASINR